MPPSKHVKVVIRTRPTSNFANEIIKLSPDQKSVHIHIRKNEDGGFINNQQENWDFRFDNVLHNASQEAVYEDCAGGIVKGLFEGYNGTILAYGQTGAGKTFTMTGATESYKHRGIIPRAISQVFKEIQDRPQMAITVRVSYLEIYNETLVDLLGSLNPDGQDMSAMPDNGMTVVEDKSGVSSVKGQMVTIANSEEDALNYLFEGETNRSISNHQMNANSTRSHCIFTLHIESRSRVESTEKVTYSKLNLVDLAGSERLSKTKSSGVTLKEAMYINKSLTFLEQVIIALADKKREHIPYRQSKLSNVLRDALGGNCNTLMIGNIWGERAHIEETISTLRFATRMMCVSNAPVVNVQYDPMALIKKYEREIKELKQELSMHDTLNNRSHIQYEPFTEAQRHELQKSIKGFLESDDSEQSIEIINLRQIRELFNQFRNLYRILQTEQEDLQERVVQAQTKNATDRRESAVDGKNGIGAGAGIGGGDNSTSTEDGAGGVGEAEGSSFGIGLAPAHAKPAQSIAASSVRDLRAPGRKDSATTAGEVASKRRKSTAAKPSSLNIVTTEIQQKLMNMEEVDELPPRENPPHHEPDPPMLAASKRTEVSASGEAVPDASLALMGPPGGKRGHVGGIPISGPAPNRAEEFENFKRGKGVEMNRILNENKATLKEKRRIAKDMAEAVNRHKEEIDAVKDKVNQKRTERESRDQYKAQNEATLVIDEEEYELIGKMKELKQAYRESFDALRLARTDVEYCTRLVDSCRSKLMVEFESWYEGMFGSHLGELENMGKTNEDVMDIGEKFDKLQLERMSSEDPDSYAFYNARKNTTRKNHKQLAPLKAKRPGMPISSSGYKAMLPVI